MTDSVTGRQMTDERFTAIAEQAARFPSQFPNGFTREAGLLHDSLIIFDLHVDSLLQQCFFGYDLAQRHDPLWEPGRNWLAFKFIRDVQGRGMHQPSFNHIDLPRMVDGGYTGAAFGIHWWPDWGQQSDLTAWRGIGRQMAALQQLIDRGLLRAARGPADIRAAHAEGLLCGFPGIEGFHGLGKLGRRTQAVRLERLEQAFHRGARYLTLCHQTGNDVCTPSWSMLNKRNPPSPETPLGEFAPAVVARMNAVGMLIDVSHTNTAGILQVCELSKAPVIATHAGAQGASPTLRKDGGRDLPRLLEDRAIRAIAGTGGAVGVAFAPDFLTGSTDAPVSAVTAHVKYLINLVGEDHLLFGTDFDGWLTSIPSDLRDAADLPLFTQSLLDAGVSETAIRKMYGENFLRLWDEVLRGAKRGE